MQLIVSSSPSGPAQRLLRTHIHAGAALCVRLTREKIPLEISAAPPTFRAERKCAIHGTAAPSAWGGAVDRRAAGGACPEELRHRNRRPAPPSSPCNRIA